MLADDFIMLPIIFWKQALPPDLPRWGQAAKDFMRDNYRRVMQVKGPVQEIPTADCRVELDPNVRDRCGLPVARLSGVAHPETVRTASYMLRHARGMAARPPAPSKQLELASPSRASRGGQHQAGTCRMGDDPRDLGHRQWGRV